MALRGTATRLYHEAVDEVLPKLEQRVVSRVTLERRTATPMIRF